MKNRVVVVAMTFVYLTALSANDVPDIWSKVDPTTTELFRSCDALVEQGLYLSAFRKLEKYQNQNAFVLARQLTICICYFAQSINHQMFGLVDLKPGQELEKLRQNGGTFDLVAFDPEKKFGSLLTSENAGILYLTLGAYYFDVLQRYSGSWLISNKELLSRIETNYEEGFARGFYDASALRNYSITEIRLGQFDKANEKFGILLTIDSGEGDDYYNYALSLLRTRRDQEALVAIKKAITLYKNIHYIFDSYLMASDISTNLASFVDALHYLSDADSLIPGDYHIPLKMNAIYLIEGDFENATKSAVSLFAMAPENPAAAQMLLTNYGNANKSTELLDVFSLLAVQYKDNQKVMANILFHQSQVEFNLGRKQEAQLSLAKARASFSTFKGKNDPIFSTIEGQAKIYEK